MNRGVLGSLCIEVRFIRCPERRLDELTLSSCLCHSGPVLAGMLEGNL